MEFSDIEEKNEHEAIEKSMQMIPIQASSSDSNPESGPPHEALFLALAYLPVYELLAMSEVCLSLRDAVNKDVLPWINIVVDKPLNQRLSEEILMKITSKADGKLRTLALINCERITNRGLQQIIEKNPFIKKLYIPGCTGLTPEGIIKAVEKLSENKHTLESLHIRGTYRITKEHLRNLQSYLQVNSAQHQQNQKKQHHILYHEDTNYLLLANEGGKGIDVEICPKCDEVRMVFDCTKDACKRKLPAYSCRGCCLCIPWCAECGGCVELDAMEHVVCKDILCLDCWLQLAKCNLCNKPYCRQHANLGSNSSDSPGFVCDVCQGQSQQSYYVEFEI